MFPYIGNCGFPVCYTHGDDRLDVFIELIRIRPLLHKFLHGIIGKAMLGPVL